MQDQKSQPCFFILQKHAQTHTHQPFNIKKHFLGKIKI